MIWNDSIPIFVKCNGPYNWVIFPPIGTQLKIVSTIFVIKQRWRHNPSWRHISQNIPAIAKHNELCNQQVLAFGQFVNLMCAIMEDFILNFLPNKNNIQDITFYMQVSITFVA